MSTSSASPSVQPDSVHLTGGASRDATVPTPGPWHVLADKDEGRHVIQQSEGLMLSVAFTIGGLHVDEQDANARLICAAPALLAALHSAAESLEQLVKIARIPANNKGLRDARAAIALATEAS